MGEAAFRDDRSPLRWLAPVIERVMGETMSPRAWGGSPPRSPQGSSPRSGGPSAGRARSPRGSSPKTSVARGDDSRLEDEPDHFASKASAVPKFAFAQVSELAMSDVLASGIRVDVQGVPRPTSPRVPLPVKGPYGSIITGSV